MGKIRKKLYKRAAKLAIDTARRGVVRSMKNRSGRPAAENNENEKAGITPRIAGSLVLRQMREGDRKEVAEMMREFYASEMVMTNGSEEIFGNDISECLSDSPYLQGFVFAYKDSDSSLWGYAMIAHSFSTEFGKPCIWIEDLYLREEARGMGLASEFFSLIEEEFPDSLVRLEAEHQNSHAMEVYKAKGFSEIPYAEMIKGATVPEGH